jgi:predicted small lipoprotein YifL
MTMSRSGTCLAVALAACVLAGCGEPGPPVFNSAAKDGPPVGKAPADAPATNETNGGRDAATDDSAETADPVSTNPGDEEGREAAFTDDRGNYGGGYLSEVVSARFTQENRIKNLHFAKSLRDGIEFYKAGHNGRGPQSHEEFMREVVAAHGINLPELKSGEEFRYDPEAEKLLIAPVAD